MVAPSFYATPFLIVNSVFCFPHSILSPNFFFRIILLLSPLSSLLLVIDFASGTPSFFSRPSTFFTISRHFSLPFDRTLFLSDERRSSPRLLSPPFYSSTLPVGYRVTLSPCTAFDILFFARSFLCRSEKSPFLLSALFSAKFSFPFYVVFLPQRDHRYSLLS